MNELEASVARVDALRKKRPVRFEGSVGPLPEGAPLASAVARRAVETIRDPHQLFPLTKELAASAGIVFPRLSDLSAKIMIEPDFDDENAFLAARWPSPLVGTALYGLNPTEEEMDKAVALAEKSRVVILFCYDAHLHPHEQILLDRAREKAHRLVVVLMRDPFDRSLLKPRDTALAIFGWRKCQIEAALSRILGAPVR